MFSKLSDLLISSLSCLSVVFSIFSRSFELLLVSLIGSGDLLISSVGSYNLLVSSMRSCNSESVSLTILLMPHLLEDFTFFFFGGGGGWPLILASLIFFFLSWSTKNI